MLGGNDPIHGISVYPRSEPVPHFHFVTYGFTDLFDKETDDPDDSGFGFELTFRLARARRTTTEPPTWALNFLQNLGRYVFGTGNRFAAGHKMGLNGPIALEHDTEITAICFADDPELGDIDVGVRQGAVRPDRRHHRRRVQADPGVVDDRARRASCADEAAVPRHRSRARLGARRSGDRGARSKQRVAVEGSSEDLTFAGELALDDDDGHVRIEIGALYAAALPRAMRGRIRHGRDYTLRGRERDAAPRAGRGGSATRRRARGRRSS